MAYLKIAPDRVYIRNERAIVSMVRSVPEIGDIGVWLKENESRLVRMLGEIFFGCT